MSDLLSLLSPSKSECINRLFKQDKGAAVSDVKRMLLWALTVEVADYPISKEEWGTLGPSDLPCMFEPPRTAYFARIMLTGSPRRATNTQF